VDLSPEIGVNADVRREMTAITCPRKDFSFIVIPGYQRLVSAQGGLGLAVAQEAFPEAIEQVDQF
jgi:hypothetical protein